MTELTPVYEDIDNEKPVPLNKITLAPKTDRESTYLLKPHVGTDGRNKDAEIFKYLGKFSEFEDQTAAFNFAMGDSNFQDIAIQALDLDDDWNEGILGKIQLMDLFEGFMDAISFRTNAARSSEIDAAEKK
jgi:hypothetical protein